MEHIARYIKRKSADGTVSIIALTALATFNLLYFVSQYAINQKFSFLKVIKDPIYIIASSIFLAAFISSFIFHKIKTKSISYSEYEPFADKVKEISNDNKQYKIAKITLGLKPNGIEMPYFNNSNVIEIPVLYNNTGDKEIIDNSKPFEKGVAFERSVNKSTYHYMLGSIGISYVINQIGQSPVDFFKFNSSDYIIKKYENGNLTLKQNPNMCNEIYLPDTTLTPYESFQLNDLCRVSFVKFYYEDGASKKVKLKLKQELPANMELFDYVNDIRSKTPNPLLKEAQIMFIPALAGNSPMWTV